MNLTEFGHKKQKRERNGRRESLDEKKEGMENRGHVKEYGREEERQCVYVCVVGLSVNLDLSSTPHK